MPELSSLITSRAAAYAAAFPRETSAWYYARYRPAYPDIVIDRLLDGPWFTPGSLIVDIGCGTGQLAMPLAARGARVIAIDSSRDMLEEGRARASSSPEASRIQWIHGQGEDITRLVGIDEPIDLIVFGKSFHLTDRARMLEHCDRLIAPRGAIGVLSGAWTHGRQPHWWDAVDDVLRAFVGAGRVAPEAAASERKAHHSLQPTHEDVLRASAFSDIRCTSLRISVVRALAEVIGLVCSIPGYSPVDLNADRFELLVSELHGRLQPDEGSGETFMEERTLDVRLASRVPADVSKAPIR
jgi:ubiquinone/menaquinone biosynthesis C-methylase UbiE